jgi:hypothetical protein
MQQLPRGTITVQETEKKYLKIIFSHLQSLFASAPLPSHDQLHHLRVWYFASELIKALSIDGFQFSSDQTRNLILAVLFHDTGLTQTLKKDHGLESRKICEHFIMNHPRLFQFDTTSALDAIEKHDDKGYTSGAGETGQANILNVLSVCDDVDAYGAIGVLRYAEIYLLRGNQEKEIPGLILPNLKCRFNYFAAQRWVPPSFFLKHKARYEFASRYYRAITDTPGGDKSLANIDIIRKYMDQVTTKKTELQGFAEYLALSENQHTKQFGEILKDELKLFFINLPL